MSQEKPSVVPTPFRGLRVLLVDNDTESLLNIASELENYSYRVTTTELATVALSILQERTDHFDLVMADISMTEMDFFKFIKNVHLIKDVPIILISSEENRDRVKEAMTKGASFFLKKPISSKNLINVWQHVYKKWKQERIKSGKAGTKGSNADQEYESQGAEGDEERDNTLKIVKESTLQEHENEEVGDSDQVGNDLDNLVRGERLAKSTGDCMKISVSTENDGPGLFLKRKRNERCEGSSHIQGKFSTKMASLNQYQMDLMTENASSSNSLDQKQFHASVETNKKKKGDSGTQSSA